jgi:predicted Fe-Mo cluster-binding NifX family protein
MKIIVTAVRPFLDAEIDPRFGRGAYFVIVDTDTLEWRSEANPAVSAPGGAGTHAAQFAASQRVDAVVSGDFGPKAASALTAAGIDMYLPGPGGTVREAVLRFRAGELQPFTL